MIKRGNLSLFRSDQAESGFPITANANDDRIFECSRLSVDESLEVRTLATDENRYPSFTLH